MLAAVTMLVPAVHAWVRGGQLARLQSSPMLGELRVAFGKRAMALASFGGAVASVLSGWWLTIPATWLLMTPAFYRVRRALLGETWPFARYLGFQVRFVLGGSLLLVLLATTPLVVLDLQKLGAGPWAALPLAALMLVLSQIQGWTFAVFLGARPLDRPDLEPRLAEIVARSRAPAPQVLQVAPPGGRLANAFAIWSGSRRSLPRVVIGGTLLDALSPEETAAIFAHEVGHLEHAGEKRRRFTTVILLALIAGATLLLPAVRWLGLKNDEVWAAFLWAIAVFIAWAKAMAAHKAHEAESDRRAVELCGDPEALIRALTRIHVLSNTPRRWDPEQEQEATHPSLVNRIRAIRQAAGTAPAQPRLETEVVARCAQAGQFVILGPDAMALLDDVAPGGDESAEALRRGAGRTRAWSYRTLSDLRVRPGKTHEDPRLTIRERGTAPVEVVLHPDCVAGVQAALDIVDLQVEVAPLARVRDHRLLVSALMVAAMFLVIRGSISYWVLLPLSAAVFSPSPATMLVAGGTLIGAAMLELLAWLGGAAPARAHWWLVVAAVIGVALVGIAWRQVAAGAGGRRWPAWLAGGLTFALGAAVLAGDLDLQLAHVAASSYPALTAGGWGLAALLLLGVRRRRRLARITGVALWLLSLAPIPLAGAWGLLGGGGDPLQGELAEIAWRELPAAGEVVPVPVDLVNLQMTTTGRTFLGLKREATVDPRAEVRSDDEEDEGVDSDDPERQRTYVVLQGFGRPHELQALQARTLDDERILVLRPAGAGLTLEVLDVGGTAAGWKLALPATAHPELDVDPVTGRWRVAARTPRGGERSWHTGRVETAEMRTERAGQSPEDSGALARVLIDGRNDGFALRPLFSREAKRAFLGAMRGMTRSELRTLDPRRSAVALTADVHTCSDGPVGLPGAVCLGVDGEHQRLMLVDLWRHPRPLVAGVRRPGFGLPVSVGRDGAVVLLAPGRGSVAELEWLDLNRAVGVHLGASRSREKIEIAIAPGKIALLRRSAAGASTLSVHDTP